MERNLLRLQLAGLRPSKAAAATRLERLHLRLLCDLQSIIYLDP